MANGKNTAANWGSYPMEVAGKFNDFGAKGTVAVLDNKLRCFFFFSFLNYMFSTFIIFLMSI